MRMVLAATLVALTGCPSSPPPTPTAAACRAEGHRRTARLVQKHHRRYLEVRDRTLRYLATFSIDPVELRRQGVKGKKKLVELLDAYVALHRHVKDDRVRARLRRRFRQVARATAQPGYHDLGTVDERQLRQDATSYLRACYLMERMGLDTTAYRAEIAAVKQRLDDHLGQRGPHQRLAFRWYYDHFGLELPATLKQPPADTVLARRLNPYLMSLGQAYQLTHEVFVPFDYGGKLQTSTFSTADRAYLRRALEVLTTVAVARRDVDVAGELLTSLRFLGDSDLQVYRDGLRFMLASQRPNGSFGNYEHLREKRGDRLELDLYLHTTSVAMDILPLAFEGPPTGG